MIYRVLVPKIVRQGCGRLLFALEYVRETQRAQVAHLTQLRVYQPGEFMMLDATTQRSLELVANLTDASRRHTLLEVLDHTATAMGGRMLRAWLLKPLRSPERICERLDAVGVFVGRGVVRAQTLEALRAVHDLERILSRAVLKTANARDLVALRASLQQAPKLRALLREVLTEATLLQRLYEEMDPLEDLVSELVAALVDNPPVSVREGGLMQRRVRSEARRATCDRGGLEIVDRGHEAG